MQPIHKHTQLPATSHRSAPAAPAAVTHPIDRPDPPVPSSARTAPPPPQPNLEASTRTTTACPMPRSVAAPGCTHAHPAARPRRSRFASPHSATNTIAASAHSGGRCVHPAQATAASRSPESKSDAHTFDSPAPRPHRAITAHQQPTPTTHIPHPHKRHPRRFRDSTPHTTTHPLHKPVDRPPAHPSARATHTQARSAPTHIAPIRPSRSRRLNASHRSARPARTVIRSYRSATAATQL